MEEDIKKLDIKDFPSLSAAPETCNILLVQQAGSPGKITIGLFKTMVKRDLTPSIKDGMWYIGETDTDVQAEGKSPVFRKGSTGVEWKYDTEENDVWRQLVDYSAITLTFDDLTPEEKDSLKMKLERLTPEEIAELQKPASEMITALEATNKNATDKEAERVIAENLRKEAETLRKNNETARAGAESGRVTAEGKRVTAERARATAETTRATSENTRIQNENARKTAETARATEEGKRVTSETARATAETTRSSAETDRLSEEDKRKTAETARISAETVRIASETERVKNEDARKTAETARI